MSPYPRIEWAFGHLPEMLIAAGVSLTVVMVVVL